MNLLKRALSADRKAIASLKSLKVISVGEVTVNPSDVSDVLRRYIAGELDKDTVKEWADLLASNEAYVGPNWVDDASADRYEPMWYVLQRLASPYIDGALTVEKAEGYLKELKEI